MVCELQPGEHSAGDRRRPRGRSSVALRPIVSNGLPKGPDARPAAGPPRQGRIDGRNRFHGAHLLSILFFLVTPRSVLQKCIRFGIGFSTLCQIKDITEFQRFQ